jgi:glutamate formiminotransferase/formiminotetrahydrofolate cyclodeaminase
MTTPIIECIPNFSEARRPEIIKAIMQAVEAVPGVSLLDRHSDLDHNRTVLTFVGPPGEVEQAAFQAIARAAELINLDQHSGEHPRIGATDVVPFVPISGVSMQACVEIARRLGQRVGEELGIPVYLYEEAAARPERQNLENIRRGQYEALKEEMRTRPERAPDFGPAKVGPAGATVIGARHPLIAFNVYLNSDDVAIAKKIAKAVRHSSGGLRYVKGLGLLVEGRAQVSMNLTNFRATPVARVVEMIRREAARYGVGIHHSELVGLIPQEALVDAAIWHLQLDQFEPEQILEQRMAAALQRSAQTQAEADAAAAAQDEGGSQAGFGSLQFLDALAAGTPAPGGGSASAYSAAAGAALVEMVARLTIGKKKYVAVETQMQSILEQAESLRAELTAAIQRDARAFEAVMAAFKLPKDTPEQREARDREVERATLNAARVPLEVAGMSVEVMDLAAQAVELGNLNAISDGASGSALAQAALTGAGYNVRINVMGLQNQEAAQDLLNELSEIETRAATIEGQVRSQLSKRGGLPLE